MLLHLEDRRAPRTPVTAEGSLAVGRARLPVTSKDVGPGGCRVLAPVQLRRGEAVYVVLQLAGGELACSATVAWCTRAAPWLVGLEFARAGADQRARRLVALTGAGALRAAPPAPLAGETPLRLGEAPHPRTAFSREELQVLLGARAGLPVRAVASTPPLKRAVVKLLARGLVRAGGQGAGAGGWSAILRDEGPALAARA